MPCPLSRTAARLAACSLPLALASAQLPDFVAPPGDTVLSTDRAVVQPTAGPPLTVVGGVFRFRSVTIPAGSRVLGVGSRPMLWLVDSMQVDGELTVSGADGAKVNTLNSANIPARGGRGGAAGGDGGDGTPQIAMRSFAGRSGNGPGNVAGFGGTGGIAATGASRGSGGGGGAFATPGDPFYPRLWGGGSSFVQQRGIGGFGDFGASGSATRLLPGGGPGGKPFVDATDENDFVGVAYDVFRNRFVIGELGVLVGGSGGGGGGDLAGPADPFSPGFVNDGSGGGGGGGGGCLVVVTTNVLIVTGSGRITANGGHGGGGEQAASCNMGGGGGGGSGGLLILASAGQIVLAVHGETYANRDYDFVLSADGGVCTTGAFGSAVVLAKYPANGQLPISGPAYDDAPLGGFGGMGIVQLITRPGTNADGTNTVLDDNVVLLRNGVALGGAQKQRYLAWRGFDNGSGVRVDDAGVAIGIGANEGDIRPSPILMPLR